jgi:hypothetical protein
MLTRFSSQAQCFASICGYLGWVLPANTLYVAYPLPGLYAQRATSVVLS